jgi:transcriptional/translational regulatory protein YebC/TACO1
MFTRRGIINFAPGADEEKILDVALDAGADDIDSEEDGAVLVTTAWEGLSKVVEALKAENLQPDHAEVAMVAATSSPCDETLTEKVMRLIDALEELDDVQNVYSNADFPALES